MRTLTLSQSPGVLKIKEYPDAALLGKIEGAQVSALSALAMHEFELEACVCGLNECGRLLEDQKNPSARFLLKTMWTGVLTLYVKCFSGVGPNRKKVEEWIRKDREKK